jgi:hypothetical protein
MVIAAVANIKKTSPLPSSLKRLWKKVKENQKINRLQT